MSVFSLAGIVALAPSIVLAQQPSIPIIDLPEPAVRTADRLGAVLGVRQTADGKVLVNDALHRQMLLFDTLLADRIVALDSVDGTSTSYGPSPVPLISFIGDSSLFVDLKSRTVVVLDGHGRIARTIALPRPQDIVALVGATSGFDTRGRLVFRGGRPTSGPPTRLPTPASEFSDSLVLLRADFDARRVDTIGRIARPAMKLTTRKTSGGAVYTVRALDPLRPVDEWAVLSNGSIAMVRGHDYHIDWIDVDGSTRSSAKVPFEWKRLADDEKRRLDDSLRTAQDSLLAKGYPGAETVIRLGGPCGPPDEGRGGGIADGGGRGVGRSGGAGGPPPAANGNCLQALSSVAPMVGSPLAVFAAMPPLAELHRAAPASDYAQPIRMNATIADLDDNVWILPRVSTLSRRGELVYDVVNANGELIERVRLPLGRAIAGFAKGGVVYLTSGDMANGYYLERTRLPVRSR